MTLLTVGIGQEYLTIAEAVAASHTGDTIAVLAGTYVNDFVHIDHSLTLQAVGGPVIMMATVPPPNGKAILTEGGTGIDVKIDGFVFTGAIVPAPDANGAGIRYEGGTLTITNSRFFGNQDGILGGDDPNGIITISHSEFDHNGVGGSGVTHNIYIGDISSFTLNDSFIHDANIGHEVKSRAENNTITNNRIFDNDGSASYSIDLPNGGNATITGNIIEQGVNSENFNIIAYGEEGNLHAGTALSISGNVFVNDKGAGPALLNATGGTVVAGFTNNAVFGFNGNPLVNGAADEAGTVVLAVRPTLDEQPIAIGDPSPVCYSRGTHIATPAGESKIEALEVGDLVLTVTNDGRVARAIRWIGWRRIDLTRHPRPETVAPVCIQQGAFADNVPHRDLYVSPDHAVFVAGKLICARQLVNGTTIRYEEGLASVDYFHVELDEHAILLAEGLPAESYLDTGNRGFFARSDMPLVLHPDLTDETGYPARETGSCVPFVSDDANARPVWQALADRAAAIGRAAPVRATTTDAAPYLQCPDGRTIEPVHSDTDRVIFALSGVGSEVRLVSRAQSPAEARPWLSDRRRLGVRVKRIVLCGAAERREIPLDRPDIARGWWEIEHDGPVMSRWTNGAAVLPLPPIRGPVLLELHLAGAMTYAVDAVPEASLRPWERIRRQSPLAPYARRCISDGSKTAADRDELSR